MRKLRCRNVARFPGTGLPASCFLAILGLRCAFRGAEGLGFALQLPSLG